MAWTFRQKATSSLNPSSSVESLGDGKSVTEIRLEGRCKVLRVLGDVADVEVLVDRITSNCQLDNKEFVYDSKGGKMTGIPSMTSLYSVFDRAIGRYQLKLDGRYDAKAVEPPPNLDVAVGDYYQKAEVPVPEGLFQSLVKRYIPQFPEERLKAGSKWATAIEFPLGFGQATLTRNYKCDKDNSQGQLYQFQFVGESMAFGQKDSPSPYRIRAETRVEGSATFNGEIGAFCRIDEISTSHDTETFTTPQGEYKGESDGNSETAIEFTVLK